MAQNLQTKGDQSPPGSRPNMSDLRIVLVGKNASENAKVGNLILNKDAFGKRSPQPDVETLSGSVEDRKLTVVISSNLLSPGLGLQTIAHHVSKLTAPEPHAIILVLQHRDFTEKNRDTLSSVLHCFGEQAAERAVIVTTDEAARGGNERVQQISAECGGGLLGLQSTPRSQILRKVDEIIGRGATQRAEDRVRDQRIILLGKSVSHNGRVRNSILGVDVRESDVPILQHNLTMIGGTVRDRHVTVINTLHLLDPNISDHQITQTVKECVSLSDPGPHAFMIALQYRDFTEEDATRVKHVLSKFSEEAIKRTIVLTTDEDTDTSKHAAASRLIKECGGRHLEFENQSPEWQSEVCKRVDEILGESHEEFLTCEIYEDVKATSTDEEQSGFDDPGRSEEKHEERSSYKDDGKPKQSKGSEGGLTNINKWIRSSLPANFSRKQKLNLVVCGSDPAPKVSVSKLLRGKIQKLSPREMSEECVKKEETIDRRPITVVELPALSRLSEEEVTPQALRCVSLCDPGVHVFLLVIPVGPVTDEVKAEVEAIQKNFYSREHLIVMFTNDGSVNRPVTDFIKHSPETQRLIGHCGGQYCVMGLKDHENSKQVLSQLLDCIENMKTEPYSLQMYMKAQENRARRETEEKYKEELKRMENEIKALKQKICLEGAECSDDQKGLRIVLIGRTGNGKSATGNTILGRNEFLSQANMDSVTTDCQKGVGEVAGRSVAVVDTPGLFDTTLSNEQAVEEIVKCVSLSSPGPHVFVIVLSVGRFIKVETDTVDLIKKIFGPKAAQFSIVLFTRGDDLENESIEAYVERGNNAEAKKLIRDCGNRFLAFNNREKQDKTQVIQLINMIEELKNTNEGRYFTNSMFEEAEMSIKKRMEQILNEREKEIQTQNEALKAKYEMEMKNMMKRLEEEKQRADEEKMKMQNQFKEKEEKLRKESEEKEKAEQKKREIEKRKQSEEEKQQKAEYHNKIEEMKKEIENQRSQHEKLQNEREEEDRKREEKNRQEREKLKSEQERIITELKIKQEEEIKKRDLEKKMRNEEEEKERQEWVRKIKDAENDRKEEIKRQQREWEDEKKRQMSEREEEERKRKEKHEEQLREKQGELEKMRKKFEREREQEREKIEEERQKQKREREEKEREYEEKKMETKRYYEQLEQERKEEWEKRKREEDKRREEERERWKKMIEDLKQEQEEEMKRREIEEKGRKEQEEKERDEIKKEYEEKIKVIKKKHENEARKQAEEFNDFREIKEQHVQELQKILEEHRKHQELLNQLYHHLKHETSEEVENLKKKIKDLEKPLCKIL